MASSGTFAFAPSNAELLLQAFARAGVRRPAVTSEHMLNARMELNLLFSEWANKQVNLFDVVLTTQALTPGTASYSVAASTVMILDAYISPSGSTTTDRIILPISRSEYASYPDKVTNGTPSVYWFNRLVSPTITLWQPPEAADTLKYYRVTQIEDANTASGETPGVPYRWYDALVAGLAHRLARIYGPTLEAAREKDAMAAWSLAAVQDVEDVPMSVQLGFSSYYR